MNKYDASDVDSDDKLLMDEFRLNDEVAELAVVDDLWYFIKKKSCWIVGSGECN